MPVLKVANVHMNLLGSDRIEYLSDNVIRFQANAIQVPIGTTDQRSASGNGRIRFNTDLNRLETYINSEWDAIATANTLVGDEAFTKANAANIIASLAYDKANSSNIIAGLAYNKANAANVLAFNALPNTTATFNGNLTIGGSFLRVSNIHHDASGFTRTQVSAANTYTVFTGNSERIRIDSSGNVGIGTTSPTSNLHVIGTANITSALTASSIELGNASDTTLARSSAGDITIEGNIIYRAGGTDVGLADGGTGASLTDPNADRIMFWDDSANSVAWLTPGTGLTISGTTITAPGSVDRQVFDASGTWTKPSTGTVALIECWGGGGSGARASVSGGGGGGGGYSYLLTPLSSLTATVTVTIGAGGASRTGSNQSGASGGNSTFGSYVAAYGGAGGFAGGNPGGGGGGPAGAASGGTGGLPNGGATPGKGGDPTPSDGLYFHGGGGGGVGGAGASAYYGGGGGGGSGGSGSLSGGNSVFGGNGGAAGSTGTSGSQPGGGGGYGSSTSGAGGAGRIIVTVW